MLLSPMRGKDPESPSFSLGTQAKWPDTSRELFSYFYFILILVFNHYNPLFLSNPNIQMLITSVKLSISHFHEENSSLWTILKPLYRSSNYIAVGGIRYKFC